MCAAFYCRQIGDAYVTYLKVSRPPHALQTRRRRGLSSNLSHPLHCKVVVLRKFAIHSLRGHGNNLEVTRIGGFRTRGGRH
jgi:hypothetical protein